MVFMVIGVLPGHKGRIGHPDHTHFIGQTQSVRRNRHVQTKRRTRLPYWGEGYVLRSPANIEDMWSRSSAKVAGTWRHRQRAASIVASGARVGLSVGESRATAARRPAPGSRTPAVSPAPSHPSAAHLRRRRTQLSPLRCPRCPRPRVLHLVARPGLESSPGTWCKRSALPSSVKTLVLTLRRALPPPLEIGRKRSIGLLVVEGCHSSLG
jgi:hypothetical protein